MSQSRWDRIMWPRCSPCSACWLVVFVFKCKIYKMKRIWIFLEKFIMNEKCLSLPHDPCYHGNDLKADRDALIWSLGSISILINQIRYQPWCDWSTLNTVCLSVCQSSVQCFPHVTETGWGSTAFYRIWILLNPLSTLLRQFVCLMEWRCLLVNKSVLFLFPSNLNHRDSTETLQSSYWVSVTFINPVLTLSAPHWAVLQLQ